jgi:hypothetical protein
MTPLHYNYKQRRSGKKKLLKGKVATTTKLNHTTDNEHKQAVQAIGYYDSMYWQNNVWVKRM